MTYEQARKDADSVRETDTDAKELTIEPGSNGGYFISYAGLTYRYDCVEDVRKILAYADAIVNMNGMG